MGIDIITPKVQFDFWNGKEFGNDLIRQVWAIAEDSFPPEEREPCPVFLQSIENGRSVLYTASHDDAVIGFTKLTPLGQSSLYLMEYLAVDKKFRNQGLGSGILLFVKNHLQGQKDAAILLEVEPPMEVSGSERQMRERRIRFYQRHGAALIMDQDAYRMPNLAAEGSLWMHLMWLPVRDGCQPPPDLSLAGLFKLIFSEVYPGEINDQLISQILKQIPNIDAPITFDGIQ